MRSSSFAVLLAVATVSFAAPTGAAATAAADQPALRAIARSVQWLEGHPPDPKSDRLGNLCLDAWAWYELSARHPDAALRARAGAEADRRLRALPLPTAATVVSLSYWATLLRLMQLRGIDGTRYRKILSAFDIATVMRGADPTTAWWTTELFRQAGLHVTASFASTFIAAGTASPPAGPPLVPYAYRLFHELVPATDFGREPPTALTPAQQAFVRRTVPGAIHAARAAGDTDGVVEALISASLMGQRELPAYRDGIVWVLRRQHPDGTYRTAREASGAPMSANDYRHVVLLASWALLTSLEPREQPRAASPSPAGQP